MNIAEMADLLITEPKEVRRFLKSSDAFVVIEVSKLTSDSVLALLPLFDIWCGFTADERKETVAPKVQPNELPINEEDEIIIDDGEISVRSLRPDGLYSPAHRKHIHALANKQNAWLEKRLHELGKSLGKKKKDPKWLTDEYVTGKKQGKGKD